MPVRRRALIGKFKSYILEAVFWVNSSISEGSKPSDLSKFGLEFRESAPEELEQEMNLLTSLLRKTPCWYQGHMRLGFIALEAGRLELAFSSFEAVRTLKPAPKILARADIGTARCLVAGGAYDKAIEILNQIPSGCVEDASLKECLISGYMAKEDFESARKIADEIPENQRTAQLLAVVEYLGTVR